MIANRQGRLPAIAFGRVLKVNRLRRGLSQQDLAERGNIHRTYPSLIEKGLRQPTLSVFLALAEVLDMAPQLLLTETLAELEYQKTEIGSDEQLK
jgi:transcriptional regulator with XRE-family HTH domain